MGLFQGVYRSYPTQVNQTEVRGTKQENLPVVSPNLGPIPLPFLGRWWPHAYDGPDPTALWQRGARPLIAIGLSAIPFPKLGQWQPKSMDIPVLSPALQQLRLYVLAPATGVIAGVTRDCTTNQPLGNCVVHLFRTSDDVRIGSTTSDGSGNYSFTVLIDATTYYLVAYKAGSPDVAGTTVNTIVAA